MASATPQPTLIRWSQSWWVYMLFRGGSLRAAVNGIEDALAITGRTLLLIYLIYCGAKAGAFLVAPDFHFPMLLEMGMFVLQLGGLEGSIPGLARRAEVLKEQDEEAAKKINKTMRSARALTIASVAEGAFHMLGVWDEGIMYISAGLLVIRAIVITGFLIELAKVDSEGPRVLSQSEHEREQQRDLLEGEQAQTIASITTQFEGAQALVEQLRAQLDGLPDLKQALEDGQGLTIELQGQLSIEQRTVSTLRLQLETEQKRAMALQEELGNGQSDASGRERKLSAASVEIESLQAQLEGKRQEIESLKEALTGNHEMQETRVKQLLDTEQERVTRLRQDLVAEQERTSTLHRELQESRLQISTLTTEQERATKLQTQLETEQEGVLTLKQQLGTSNLQIVDLSAKLETANLQIGNLQKSVDETANLPGLLKEKDQELAGLKAELQTAKLQIRELKSAKSQPAKPSDQSANTGKITSIETAKSGRISHADVLAYMDANPHLKRAEVAANLSISERKVYDAVAWGKEQNEKVAEA